jgi:hypothetical protein
MYYVDMSSVEVLEHLKTADPEELILIRDTADSLLGVSQLSSHEENEIQTALLESDLQFSKGEGISSTEAWRKLGL